MVTRCAGGRNQIQLASLLLKLFLCDCSLWDCAVAHSCSLAHEAGWAPRCNVTASLASWAGDSDVKWPKCIAQAVLQGQVH